MFGMGKRPSANGDKVSVTNQDVAKLFFDTFSNRLGSLEARLKELSVDVERLKISGDQSKLSDLVLLERLQKTEKLLGESLNWIKQVADVVLRVPAATSTKSMVIEEASGPVESSSQLTVNQPSLRTDPSVVQPGSLNSITTPTELQVLTLLAEEGPKSAPEIGKFVGRSREHTARLMKKLFDEGYVRRDQSRIPFRYSTVERVKRSLTKPESKDQGRETVSAPQA
jgi:predicted transcriptional regulator